MKRVLAYRGYALFVVRHGECVSMWLSGLGLVNGMKAGVKMGLVCPALEEDMGL